MLTAVLVFIFANICHQKYIKVTYGLQWYSYHSDIFGSDFPIYNIFSCRYYCVLPTDDRAYRHIISTLIPSVFDFQL